MDTIAGVDSSAAHDLCPQSAPMTQTVFDTFARQRFQMAARLAQANPSEHGLTYSEFLPDEVIQRDPTGHEVPSCLTGLQ